MTYNKKSSKVLGRTRTFVFKTWFVFFLLHYVINYVNKVAKKLRILENPGIWEIEKKIWNNLKLLTN